MGSAPLRARLLAGAAVAMLVLCAAPPAFAARSSRKAIWGPVTRNGQSEFPLYHELGVGIFEMSINWAQVAPTRPRKAMNPRDPAYHWPAEISYAIRQAAIYHMRILLQVMYTPSWANHGRPENYPPARVAAFAHFVTAVARRYRSVHLWMIWGEPSRKPTFGIDVRAPATATRLTRAQARGPRVYARLLNASYGALKRVNRHNLVIGGDTYTTGDISTPMWIKYMRLPDGKPPRMDLYGHNPFSFRTPDLSNPPSPDNEIDFSDLRRLERMVNRNLAPRYHHHRRHHHRIRLFLSEWTIPTAPGDTEFNFWVDPSVQAQWITDAWRIVRSSRFIYALGWIHVYDDPPGEGSTGGLLDYQGNPKPGFYAFKAG